ncbi:MAG: 4-hydroxy-3-methylbut-2-enyl diphosphate reductase, partial [Thiomonas sp.]
MVDSADDLRAEWVQGARQIGLTAGASAPEALVEQCIIRLKQLGAVSVQQMAGVSETVQFPLPRGLLVKAAG